MLASFIVTFTSDRLDNLFQTVRFLERRESTILKKCEIVLVCQDHVNEISTKFYRTRLLNLGKDKYNRPFMINTGSYHSVGEILIILDSDRIMPYRYFESAIEQTKENVVISPKHSLKLDLPYSDESIENNDIQGKLELRSKVPSLHNKNVFSGNTIMMKSDYQNYGWMDETYEGYGYSDTDFAMKLYGHGFEFILTNQVEFHLWHPYSKEYEQQNLENAIKFSTKWNVPIDNHVRETIASRNIKL